MYITADSTHNGHEQPDLPTADAPPTAITYTHVGGILVIVDPLDLIDGE